MAAGIGTGISALLLAAHFLRSGHWLLVAAAVLVPWLLLLRRAWTQRAVQCGLALGALEWVRTAFVLVPERRAAGLPWTRLGLILGAVALFTVGTALLLERRSRGARRPPASRAPGASSWT